MTERKLGALISDGMSAEFERRAKQNAIDHYKARAEKAEARAADLERTAQCAEDMRDASDARVTELEAALQRSNDMLTGRPSPGTIRARDALLATASVSAPLYACGARVRIIGGAWASCVGKLATVEWCEGQIVRLAVDGEAGRLSTGTDNVVACPSEAFPTGESVAAVMKQVSAEKNELRRKNRELQERAQKAEASLERATKAMLKAANINQPCTNEASVGADYPNDCKHHPGAHFEMRCTACWADVGGFRARPDKASPPKVDGYYPLEYALNALHRAQYRLERGDSPGWVAKEIDAERARLQEVRPETAVTERVCDDLFFAGRNLAREVERLIKHDENRRLGDRISYALKIYREHDPDVLRDCSDEDLVAMAKASETGSEGPR